MFRVSCNGCSVDVTEDHSIMFRRYNEPYMRSGRADELHDGDVLFVHTDAEQPTSRCLLFHAIDLNHIETHLSYRSSQQSMMLAKLLQL